MAAADDRYRRIPSYAGDARLATMPQGPNGRALCRRCDVEVPKGRLTFCSDGCVHEWKLRTNPGYQRRHVFERDRGVCADCGRDTEALRVQLLDAWKMAVAACGRGCSRRTWSENRDPRTACTLATYHPTCGRWREQVEAFGVTFKRLPRAKHQYSQNPRKLNVHLWEMDHVVPVSEGGGSCGLENLRTLCRWCHAKRTTALRARLKAAR